MTPFFVDRGAHPRLPLSPPLDDLAAGESPAHWHYAQRLLAMEMTVRELLVATQTEQKLDAGRVDTVFKVGDRVLLRTKERISASCAAAAAAVGRPLHRDGLPEPQRPHPRAATADALQPYCQR